MSDIITIAGTIVGVAVGSAITWWGTIDLSKRQTFNIAAAKFIVAFTEEIAAIKNKDPAATCDVYRILNSSFAKHNAAVVEFRYFLSESCVVGFDEAWETYRKHSANFGNEWPDRDRMNHLGEYSSVGEQQARELALERLDKLLGYAKFR